jgi:hypothetical protein
VIATFSVGTTETQVIPAPASFPYRFVAIGNNGASAVYLKLTPDTAAVTTSNGIPLQPSASLVFDQPTARLGMFQKGVTAIATAAASVSVQYY